MLVTEIFFNHPLGNSSLGALAGPLPLGPRGLQCNSWVVKIAYQRCHNKEKFKTMIGVHAQIYIHIRKVLQQVSEVQVSCQMATRPLSRLATAFAGVPFQDLRIGPAFWQWPQKCRGQLE